MTSQFTSRLLTGAAFVALVAAAFSHEAAAQYVSGGQAPGTVSLSAEGGYAMGTGTNDTVWAEQDTIHFRPFSFNNSPVNVGSGDGFLGRAAFGWQYDPTWSFGVMYTGLRSRQGGSQSGILNTVEGAGHPVFHHQLPTIGFNGDVANKVSADIADFQVGYDLGLGGGGIGTALFGVEYGHFGQKTDVTLSQFFTQSGSDRQSTFTGGGPTIGFKGQMPITGELHQGFGVVGQVQGGVLYGHLDSTTTSYGLGGYFSPYDERVVSRNHVAGTAEGQLALTYEMPVGAASSVQVALGYQALYLARVRDSQNGISLVGSSYGSQTDDLLYHGPFLRLTYNWGVAAAPPPPPPPPTPAAAVTPPPKREERKFIVFFDFDKSTLTPDGKKIVETTAASFKATGAAHLDLTGYTDLAGTQAYNLKLSERRAETVRAYLVQLGVPASDIGVYWRGKENPRVPTPDGVREPQNRRVEIIMP